MGDQIHELGHALDGAVRTDQDPAEIAWLLVNLAVGYGMVLPIGPRGMASAQARRGMQDLLHDVLTD